MTDSTRVQRAPSHPASDGTPATSWALNPWTPMSKPIDVKHLGKLAEELGEASSAVARCLIQGIEESEPVTHKPNRQWLEDELADVIANIDLVAAHFSLDTYRMNERAERKKEHLHRWHLMLEAPPPILPDPNEGALDRFIGKDRQAKIGCGARVGMRGPRT